MAAAVVAAAVTAMREVVVVQVEVVHWAAIAVVVRAASVALEVVLAARAVPGDRMAVARGVVGWRVVEGQTCSLYLSL